MYTQTSLYGFDIGLANSDKNRWFIYYTINTIKIETYNLNLIVINNLVLMA